MPSSTSQQGSSGAGRSKHHVITIAVRSKHITLNVSRRVEMGKVDIDGMLSLAREFYVMYWKKHNDLDHVHIKGQMKIPFK